MITSGAVSAAGGLLAANNLSDVASPSTALTNLGIFTAALLNEPALGSTTGWDTLEEWQPHTMPIASGSVTCYGTSGTYPFNDAWVGSLSGANVSLALPSPGLCSKGSLESFLVIQDASHTFAVTGTINGSPIWTLGTSAGNLLFLEYIDDGSNWDVFTGGAYPAQMLPTSAGGTGANLSSASAGKYPKSAGGSPATFTVSTLAAAGVGTCAAGQVATALNGDAAPTCATPAAADTGNTVVQSTSGFAPIASSATNFGATLSTQTLVASAPANGLYAVYLSPVVTLAGVGCSAGSNTMTITLAWTSPGSFSHTNGLTSLTASANGTLGGQQGENAQVIYVASGTAITYTTGSTLASTGCSTTPQYTVYARVIG
jgi:hypothetical protein